jgi:flagellar hook-basal body complex protein FliE
VAIDPLSASKAYAQAANTVKSSAESVGAPLLGGDAQPHGLSFGDVLHQAISGVVHTGRKADHAIASAAVGKGDLVDVVTAISAAEMSLETLVAVRDQAIGAYQEVMRMNI